MIRKKFSAAVVFIIISGLLAGCFKMQLDTRELQEPVFLSQKTPKEYTRLSSFELKTSAAWSIFGAVSVKKANLASLLKKEIERQNGDAIVNLTIKSQITFTDGLITIIAALGLFYSPRTVVVSGTVVDVKEETPLPSPESLLLKKRQSGSGIVYYTEEIVTKDSEIIF